MTTQFTWIPIYQELADVLANWQNRQGELISFLENLRAQEYVITPFMDRDEDGARFPLKEIDPFTFFGVFNRGIKQEQRIAILSEIKKFFGLQSTVPDDFAGIPIVNNQSSWFISFQDKREIGDVEKLWRVFCVALTNSPFENTEFLEAFDEALTVRRTNINLTMGLFWIRPYEFLNLDGTNRTYLHLKLPKGGLSAKYYKETVQEVRARGIQFPEISLAAWNGEDETPISKKVGENKQLSYITKDDINYWLVGAYWDDRDPADQTKRFLEEGVWENGYNNRFNDEVRSMKVGDKIAIKAASTQKRDLPFDNRNKTISRLIIKATGTIIANRNDGRVVEVEWDPIAKERNWYFYTNRNTVWHLRFDEAYKFREYSKQLRDFVWYGKDQDYKWFTNLFWKESNTNSNVSEDLQGNNPPYSIEDMIASGIFLNEAELTELLDRLKAQKALILQGPPGVGKTFIARKLAYALMEEIDNRRMEMVQFHQSYSYDDFVRGYRPLPGQSGTFGLQNGVFYEFCQKAINDPDQEYVFIIDEINRGNLSQIFGELLMLIEHDKRGKEFSVPLVYRIEANEPRFYIPSNLYIIGLMNLADRSLAMVDYALRRRFAFFDLMPQYENDLFANWLKSKSMNPELIQLIASKLSALNKVIREDPLLGENYQIGHSYFCPNGESFAELNVNWYRSIIKTQIIPLLKEYWFDNPKKTEDAVKELLG